MDALKGLMPGSFVGLDQLRASKLEDTAKAAKSDPKHDEAVKAATEFEGLLLKQMLSSMWNTVPSDSLLGGSQEEKMYRDFYTDAVAKDISEKQSLGIKDVILRELTKK